MYDLNKIINLFHHLVKKANESSEKKPSEENSSKEKPSEEIKENKNQDVQSLASDAIKTGGQKLINFMKTHGKDMSQSTPNRAFIYEFPEKQGSTCLFDNRIVHFKTKLIPVERQVREEMRSDNYKAVEYIVKWIRKKMPDVSENPALMEGVTLNVIGQKGAEGSRLNYNFGFIQATVNSAPDQNWKGHVFVISDYNTKNGVKVPFIWPYVSFLSFESGINYWLDFLQRRGFLNAAKGSGMQFVEALQKGRYFDLPTKTITDPDTGKTKKVIDEENARKKRENYYKNTLRIRKNENVTKAVKDFIYI